VHELQKYCRSKSMYIWASACTCWYPVWQIPIRGVGAMEVVGATTSYLHGILRYMAFLYAGIAFWVISLFLQIPARVLRY
jgi:hypothetical protein